MIVKCFVFMYLSLLLYLLPMCCSVTERAPTSGPFKSSIVSVKDCSNPSKPYLKNPSIIFLASVHNIMGKNTLEGNFTVLKDTKNVKMKLRGFVYRDGKWIQSSLLNQMDCHGSLVHITLLAANIKYDRNTCMFLKGSYSLKNMDANQMQHIWASTMQYGHVMRRSEIYSKDGVYFCKEFETVVEPA